MKRLIYQVKVGPNPPSFYDICIQSVSDYCKKYNIDHIIQTEPILKIRPLKSARSEEAVERLGYLPIYEKENAFNYLDRYDQIAIIDSDIYIRNISPNIFDELENDTVFAGVYEKDMPLTKQYLGKIKSYSAAQYGNLENIQWNKSPKYGIAFYNMGLMLFSNKIVQYLNGESPEQFIRRKEFEKFVNGDGNWRWSTDQTLLNYWITSSGMKTKNLNWKWNTLFKAVQDDKLSESYFIHFFLSNNLPERGQEIPYIIENLDRASSINYGHR